MPERFPQINTSQVVVARGEQLPPIDTRLQELLSKVRAAQERGPKAKGSRRSARRRGHFGS